MIIWESLIYDCTLVGENKHQIDIGIKREQFGAFSGFPAKRRKVNPMTKSQLMVNPDFGTSKSQMLSPENVAQDNSGRLTEKLKSQPWPTSKVKVKVQVKVNLVTHKCAPTSSRTTLDLVRWHIDYSSILSSLVIFPPCPSLKSLDLGSNPTQS